MEIIIKLVLLCFLFFIIYLWNKYFVSNIVRFLFGIHQNHNSLKLHERPNKVVSNEALRIIKTIKVFFWCGFGMVAYQILVN